MILWAQYETKPVAEIKVLLLVMLFVPTFVLSLMTFRVIFNAFEKKKKTFVVKAKMEFNGLNNNGYKKHGRYGSYGETMDNLYNKMHYF